MKLCVVSIYIVVMLVSGSTHSSDTDYSRPFTTLITYLPNKL